MCQICEDLVKNLLAKGFTENEAMMILWEMTPFPVGTPTQKQIEEINKMKPYGKPSKLVGIGNVGGRQGKVGNEVRIRHSGKADVPDAKGD